ncbi:MAG: hypothetical protein LCH46_02630 [Proteobacteria bacterium]|nr:hypothetical protein [Pseudomonadota bacterium]
MPGFRSTTISSGPFLARPGYADAVIAEYKHLSGEDLLATTTEFAAYSIVRSIAKNVKSLSEISTNMAFGATRFGILGKLAQPPRLAKL